MFRFRSHRAVVVATIFTLSGCGGGGSVTPHTTPTPAVTPTPASGAGTTATVTFTTWLGQPTPKEVAYEVNGGTWKTATLAGAMLSIPLPAGATSYGFGFVCPSAASTFQQFYELSPKDTTAVTNVGCFVGYTVPTISATYDDTAIADANAGTVQTAGAAFNNTANFTTAHGGATVEIGPATSDVMETATENGTAVAVHLLRSQALTAGESLVLPDMVASDATKNTETLTAGGAGYTGNSVNTYYQTADGATFNLGGAGTLAPIPQIAAAQAMPGDSYGLTAQGRLPATQDSGTTEIITTNPTSQTVTVPPVWTYAAPAASDTPAFPVNYTGFSVSGFGWDGVELSSGTSLSILVVSRAVAGTTPSLSMPNLSALGGFVNPVMSGPCDWSVGLEQTNAPSWISPNVNFPIGTEIQSQAIDGTFTAP